MGSQNLSHLAYLNDDRWNDETDKTKLYRERMRKDQFKRNTFLPEYSCCCNSEATVPFWSYPHPIRGPTFHPAEELIPPLQWCHPTCLPWRTSLQNVQPGQMAWWCPAKRSKKHHGQRQTSNQGGISTGTTRRSSDRKSKYWCLFSQFSNILR